MDAEHIIQVQDHFEKADIDRLGAGLREFNRLHVEDDNRQPLAVFLRDGDDQIVGGLHGDTYWGWLYVAAFWIHPDLRLQGYGEKLLRIAEEEAIRRGCHHAHLDTMSFQALPFYEKQGYEVFGQIDDLPVGHTRYFLKKKLG